MTINNDEQWQLIKKYLQDTKYELIQLYNYTINIKSRNKIN